MYIIELNVEGEDHEKLFLNKFKIASDKLFTPNVDQAIVFANLVDANTQIASLYMKYPELGKDNIKITVEKKFTEDRYDIY